MTSGDKQVRPRLVDAHVHHWDPANLRWYPHLAPDFDVSALGVTEADGMKRRYLLDEYLADATPWNLDKYVHVNATSGPKAYLAEAEWLAGLGGPLAAVIGTVDLEQEPAAALADLTAQAGSPLFRGIRTMHIPDYDSPTLEATLRFLAERGLVYDFVVHPASMPEAAEVVRRHRDLTVVIEHAGWPTSTDDAERARWRDGMRALADAHEGVACKLSGIAMATHTLDLDAVHPWFDEVLATFGTGRCLVGSNFPVDGVFGSFDQLMGIYLAVVDAHGDAAVEAVFAANAERIYGI